MTPLLVLSGISLLSACSLLPMTQAPATGQAASTPASARAEASSASAKSAPGPDRRQVGDLVVHRFSGSFRRTPLLLTEEVVAKDGEHWVVEVTLEDGATTSRFRVHMDDEGDVTRAARLDGTREVQSSLSEYHASIDATVFAADANDGLFQSEQSTCLLGSRELECEVKSYRVRVGAEAATLKVSGSSELPGRDLSGEIVTADGRTLYRSELLTIDRQKPGRSLATR
jgi:hypothetical protein